MKVSGREIMKKKMSETANWFVAEDAKSSLGELLSQLLN